MSVREDIKRGVYIDGITEEPVTSPEDAYRVRTNSCRIFITSDSAEWRVESPCCCHVNEPRIVAQSLHLYADYSVQGKPCISIIFDDDLADYK